MFSKRQLYSNFLFQGLSKEATRQRTIIVYPMPLPKFTRFIAIRLRAGPSVTEGLGDHNTPSDVLRIGAGTVTWIDNFIRALNVASAVGGSFPPLKVATETLNVVLKDLRV